MNASHGTRQEAESATRDAMSLLGTEISKHVGDVYDHAYRCGFENGQKQGSSLLETIAANCKNDRLDDSQFREFVCRIANQY